MTRPAPKHPIPAWATDVLRHIDANNGRLMIVTGVHTTVAASDTKVTGLASVVACGVSMGSDPVDDPFMCSATIGDQAGTPAAGSILIKTWKNTGGTDPTPAAATTFSKLVNWWAVGVPVAEIDDPVA